MSARPAAIRKHNHRKGNKAALRQWLNWRKRQRHNPPLTVKSAALVILWRYGGTLDYSRLRLEIALLTLAGGIDAPMPTRQEIQHYIKALQRSDDPDDISCWVTAQHRLKSPMPTRSRRRAPPASPPRRGP